MTIATFEAAGAPAPISGPIAGTTDYVPGQCNIGQAEIAGRRRAGHVGVVATIGLLAVLVAIGAPPLTRLVIAVPAAVAASGYLQARLRFCAAFGSRGVYNFDDDRFDRARGRRRGAPARSRPGDEDRAGQRPDRARGRDRRGPAPGLADPSAVRRPSDRPPGADGGGPWPGRRPRVRRRAARRRPASRDHPPRSGPRRAGSSRPSGGTRWPFAAPGPSRPCRAVPAP